MNLDFSEADQAFLAEVWDFFTNHYPRDSADTLPAVSFDL